MPGFDKLGAMKKAEVRVKQKVDQNKKLAEGEEEKEKTGKKGFYILKERFKRNSGFSGFLSNFFASQMALFLLGSFAWLTSHHHQGSQDDDVFYTAADQEVADLSWEAPTYWIYGDLSYKQAVKNAYLWDDFRNGKGGLFQGVCGLLSILIAIGIGAKGLKDTFKTNLENAKIDFAQLEQLKDFGIDAKRLINEMEPFIAKLVSKMSEIDRGYFDNLLAGGLDKADYQTCIDIVAGHLKSNPEDYNKLVKIIDENTLPEKIRKKYGKTISFGAAAAMRQKIKTDIR